MARKLRVLGCDEIPRRSGGSHRKWIRTGAGRSAVVHDWGPKDLKQGTLRSVVQQLGLDWADFERA